MTVTTEIRDILNTLLAANRDGQKLFNAAAGAVSDAVLRAELTQYAMQREDFAHELRDALLAGGDEVDDSGSLSGTLQRGWLNLRQVFSSNDRQAVLTECERNEDRTCDTYRAARTAVLPEDVAALIETQYEAVLRVHDRIKALRDAGRQ